MAGQSEIKVKRLISMFEPIAGTPPAEIQRRVSLHNISQELEDISRKEDSSTNETATVQHVVRASSELPHRQVNTTTDREETTAQQSTDVSSGDKTKPKQMEKPKRLKDLKELLKLSTFENDRLRNELRIVTQKLESVENAFEALKREHKKQVEESIRNEALDESTMLVQNSNTNMDELRAAQEESEKEKQIRVVVEKRLKMANNKILDLTRKLKQKDKELLAYKTNSKDLKNAEKDIIEVTHFRSDTIAQSSEANKQNATPIQQSDAATNRKTEIDDASENQKRQSRTETVLEIRDAEMELFRRQMLGRKKSSQRPNIKSMQVKSLDLASDFQLEAVLEKHERTDRKTPVDSTPLCSLPFPELTDVSQSIPNLYAGLNRPKRKKIHASSSSLGSLAKRDDQLLVVYV